MIHVPASALPRLQNEFFTIPIHTQITDHQFLAVTNHATTAVGQLVEQSRGSTSIDLMFYTGTFLKKTKFAYETLLHFVVFTIVLIVAIASVAQKKQILKLSI